MLLDDEASRVALDMYLIYGCQYSSDIAEDAEDRLKRGDIVWLVFDLVVCDADGGYMDYRKERVYALVVFAQGPPGWLTTACKGNPAPAELIDWIVGELRWVGQSVDGLEGNRTECPGQDLCRGGDVAFPPRVVLATQQGEHLVGAVNREFLDRGQRAGTGQGGCARKHAHRREVVAHRRHVRWSAIRFIVPVQAGGGDEVQHGQFDRGSLSWTVSSR